jgi:hypothetical protein
LTLKSIAAKRVHANKHCSDFPGHPDSPVSLFLSAHNPHRSFGINPKPAIASPKPKFSVELSISPTHERCLVGQHEQFYPNA